MRIAIVTSMAGGGGTETVSLRLYQLLAQYGQDPTLIAGDGPLLRDSSIQRVDIDFYSGGLLGYLKSTARLTKILRERRFDVLHCQMARPVIACVIAKALARCQARVIWHSRGLRAWTYAVVCPLFSRLRVHAAGNCVAEVEKLRRYGYQAERVFPVFNPAPRLSLKRRSAPHADSVVIGSLSRLTRDRNVSDCLIFAKQLLDAEVHVKLIVAGAGPEMETLRALAITLGISAHVEFCGQVFNPEVFFSRIDILANTLNLRGDHGAGIGNNIIEAGIAGVPVVAYDSCGIREAVIDGQTGFCVALDDRDQFVLRLRQLVSSATLRARLGDALSKHISTLCSERAVYGSLMRIYGNSDEAPSQADSLETS